MNIGLSTYPKSHRFNMAYADGASPDMNRNRTSAGRPLLPTMVSDMAFESVKPPLNNNGEIHGVDNKAAPAAIRVISCVDDFAGYFAPAAYSSNLSLRKAQLQMCLAERYKEQGRRF